MSGNYHVQFLGGKGAVKPLTYPVAIEKMDGDDNEKGDDGERRIRRRSILEGDLGTGESLTRLIDDATFMWEKLPGGNSRVERSSQQIKAAEISADFQNKFKDIMEKTISLIKMRGKRTELFVLPIDNVDRSIEHIASISKLVRLAASRRLWFILAAVRPDYQLFLERSFQNELLRSTMGSNASTWDQTQAIARRQAATSMRRTLPEKYQIRIDPLKPDYCWKFTNGRDNDKGLGVQLQGVELNLADKSSKFTNFAHLFTIPDQYIKCVRKKDNPAKEVKPFEQNQTPNIFTGAGKMALGLSMRTLLDLKAAIVQFKGEAVNTDDKGDIPINIAVRMLRNAIDESDIPFWASERLLNRIIRKNSNGRWILDLTGNPIRRFNQPPQFYPIFISEEFKIKNCRITEESLEWQKYSDVVLELQFLSPEKEKTSLPLPSVIAGWFMILYDVLVLQDQQRVITDCILPGTVFTTVARNRHKLFFEQPKIEGDKQAFQKVRANLIFEWRIPAWTTFVEHFLFAALWNEVLECIDFFLAKEHKAEEHKAAVIKINRLLHLTWIANICMVYTPYEETNPLEILADLSDIDHIAQIVKSWVHNLVSRFQPQVFGFKMTAKRTLLLKKFPLFLKPEYSVLTTSNEKYSKDSIWSKGEIEHIKNELKLNEYKDELEALRESTVRSAISKSIGQEIKIEDITDYINQWVSAVDDVD